MAITSGYVCRPAVIARHQATDFKLIVWDFPGASWSEVVGVVPSLRANWPDYDLRAEMVLFPASDAEG